MFCLCSFVSTEYYFDDIFILLLASSCCKPTIPEHSKFYSDNRYSYGDKVYTQCNEGYVTGGTALRVCQTNGQWSGSQTTCTSKVFIHSSFNEYD